MTAHAVIVNYGLISPNKAASNLSLDEGFAVVNSIVFFISIKQPNPFKSSPLIHFPECGGLTWAEL